MKNPKILMVEDDVDIFLINNEYLEGKGYEVIHASSLAQARFQFEEHMPDLILLDVMLPDGKGWDFCKEVRALSSTPIIFLTCKDENESVVKGLLEGGDDFITKPYDLDVLAAHITALLRRSGVFTAGQIELPPLNIDLLSGEVLLSGQQIHLTQKERQLLCCFAFFVGRRLTSEEICQRAWGDMLCRSKSSLAVHVSNLRKKLNLNENSYFELKSTGKEEYIFSKIRY